MQIRELFDLAKDIHRTIEKVITYKVNEETRLKNEIGEYIVTESIEEQCEKLLEKMQTAMEVGGQNEVGVWVSGFYGSGKSSFTKYLGLALDDSVTVDGDPFLKHFQNRFERPQTKALLTSLAKKFPAKVILLDLASDMVAGATQEEISTVLYYKVLQASGYSRNLKVAAFERKVRQDERTEEFQQRIDEQVGVPWKHIQDDPLVVDSVIPDVAHAMYPQLFKTPASFNTEAGEHIRFETERVEEMINIVREASGKEYILFVVDEVGQYVGSRQNLILNLQGLAENLKKIGDGKVWFIGTAQQTLTEDDPRTAINSPELFKLKDRFPIQVDLESRDIKEICTKRLLGKAPAGDKELKALFAQHGQALRHNTKLQDAKFYDADFDEKTFIDLYPFLPAHFEILLHLLGQLAKTTGGIGLRSAIKVIQDVLVEGVPGQKPVADQELGWLATTVTLYDCLEKDIRRAFSTTHSAVEKARQQFPDSALHQDIAKTVAILQILSNMPVNRHNVASLMHPGIAAPSQRDAVESAIAELINNGFVPFGEKDGSLCFFSERLNDIDQERAQLPLRAVETRRIFNDALRAIFSPLPATRLHNALTITSGIKSATTGAMASSLEGDRNPIQTVIQFVSPDEYEHARADRVGDSRQQGERFTIFLVARSDAQTDGALGEIFRCQEIARRHKNDPDQEIKEYCAGQLDRAERLSAELQRVLKKHLAQGSFVFKGDITAVDSLHQDVLEAGKKYLSGVAEQVFDRFHEAPLRLDTSLAEDFLRLGNLKAANVKTDPLGLVEVTGGSPRIRSDQKALVSIKDYLDRNGNTEGKRLMDHFTAAPFGWSQDTLRYLVAALLVSGEIKLKIGGHEVTVNGQQAIEALRTNNAFKKVGVALREDKPSNELLARAAERLTDLSGEGVVPLEEDISKAAMKTLTKCQQWCGPLAGKLENLGLPGCHDVQAIHEEIGTILSTDASDAPQRLGGEDAPLYDGIKWAMAVVKALGDGLEKTIRQLREMDSAIKGFPNSGRSGNLKTELAEDIAHLQDRLEKKNFHEHQADLNTTRSNFQAAIRDTAQKMADTQQAAVKEAQKDLQHLPEWLELTQEEQSQELGKLDGYIIAASDDIQGIQSLLCNEIELANQVSAQKAGIHRTGEERRRKRLLDEEEEAKKKGKTTLRREVRIPKALNDAQRLQALIQELQILQNELTITSDIEVTFRFEE